MSAEQKAYVFVCVCVCEIGYAYCEMVPISSRAIRQRAFVAISSWGACCDQYVITVRKKQKIQCSIYICMYIFFFISSSWISFLGVIKLKLDDIKKNKNQSTLITSSFVYSCNHPHLSVFSFPFSAWKGRHEYWGRKGWKCMEKKERETCQV